MSEGKKGVKRDLTAVCFLAQIPCVILSRSLNPPKPSAVRSEIEAQEVRACNLMTALGTGDLIPVVFLRSL